MAEKRYYWLKFYKDFFNSKRIKKLRHLPCGDTGLIIYLKMQLSSIDKGGVIAFSGLENDIADEIALDLDEEPDNVSVTLDYLLSCGLAEVVNDNGDIYLPYAEENTGSETSAAERSRKHRAKTNAERQAAFRAKLSCEANQKIPMIENHMNRVRYGGNYYICFQRDKCACRICGSSDNLCLHHIDGYIEGFQENNEKEKMVTLCRTCHAQVHAGMQIPEEILHDIGYLCNDNTTDNVTDNKSNEMSNVTSNVTSHGEIEIEKEIELEKEYIQSTDVDCMSDLTVEPGGKIPRSDIKIVMDAWNEIGVKPIQSLKSGTKRYDNLCARIRQYGMDTVLEAIASIKDSSFLQGQNNRGWTVTFEWFVLPNNFIKVVDGNYRDKPKQEAVRQEPVRKSRAERGPDWGKRPWMD